MSSHEHHIRFGESGYPRRLAALPEAPGALHVRGHLGDMQRTVAIVGGRAAGVEALRCVRALAGELADLGVQVVSGGAMGVDAAAHGGALDAGGATVAVLGCGLNVVYPEQNRKLFQDIPASGGALISQFEADAPPRSWHFPKRNATIAGLADAVLVVAASARSGALYTAHAAGRMGRLVAAMPGSSGCAALIAAGAALVHGAHDVMCALDGAPRRPQGELPEADSPEGRVLASLDERAARGADELSARTGLSAREVIRALTGLELEGLAMLVPGHNYVRSTLARELLVK